MCMILMQTFHHLLLSKCAAFIMRFNIDPKSAIVCRVESNTARHESKKISFFFEETIESCLTCQKLGMSLSGLEIS